jgi:Methyltransferase domain
MEKILIHEYLKKNDIDINEIDLGDFDFLGEYTAKKTRDRGTDLYKSAGHFFRPNYERGILIYSLIKKFKLNSFLEIGFGRGYSAICAAKALYDIGSPGVVTTIDPNVDEKQMQLLNQVFPTDWLSKIRFLKGPSQQVIPSLTEKFDMVYIDGDHTAAAVQQDWDNCKDLWNAFCLFDDYHLPSKTDSASAGIECAEVIDKVDYPKKDLIILDRRIFFDDRRIPDDKIDYGQVLLTNEEYLKGLKAGASDETKNWQWDWK